ncbi:MAG: PQQ-dependent sugar dehydrogenase [Gammaproteobacteria bacterium]|nr:PQQ-dependent sugar dehydrogenase [Gammaproteobacteria bacterium]
MKNLARTGWFVVFFLCCSGLLAQQAIEESTEKGRIRAQVLASGLDHPWSLAFLPDGRMLVTERSGRLQLLDADGGVIGSVAGLPPVAVRGQGGLLDVAVHPDFARNQLIYLSWVARGEGGTGTEVGRARFDEQTRALHDLDVLFRLTPKSGTSRHFGSRLIFDGKGFLLITLGDRGEMERAQKLDDHAGSVIRLTEDGEIPPDNPFVGRDGARAEIFSYGHRNIQGAFLHPSTGELWVHEHGPQGGDELNIARTGNNYGWPVITYGVNYGSGTKIGEGQEKPGMQQPLYYWVPSIAPSGMTFYTGDRFKEWQGNIFVGSLAFQTLVRLEVDGEKITHEERMFERRLGRIRDVRTGPDGLLYLLTDSSNGMLLRVEPVIQ